MSPPSWQYWPSQSAVPDQIISGTLDSTSGTGGAIDNNPIATPSVAGLQSVTLRQNTGVIMPFDTAAERDAFVAAYPLGTAITLTCNGTVYTIDSLSAWNLFSATARIDHDQFTPALPNAFSQGEEYVIEFYLA